MPGGRWSLRRLTGRDRQAPRRRRSSFSEAGSSDDVEAPRTVRRRLQHAAAHMMQPVDETATYQPFSVNDDMMQSTTSQRGAHHRRISVRDPDTEVIYTNEEVYSKAGYSKEDREDKAHLEDDERRFVGEVEWQRNLQYKINVKNAILDSHSGSDLFGKAESLIDADWLGDVEIIDGNIYRSMAFGLVNFDSFSCTVDGLYGLTKFLGLITIAILQVMGPPAIFLSETMAYGILEEDRMRFEEWQPDAHDWHHIALTKVLSIVAIFMFVLNGLGVVIDERRSWFKMDAIHNYLDVQTEQFKLPGEFLLHFGALVNCWVVLWCCIDCCCIVGSAESPDAVLFNSLGLLFLFNLDDVGGSLSFVEADDWPGERIGWIFEEMVVESYSKLDEDELVELQKKMSEEQLEVDAVRRKNSNQSEPLLADGAEDTRGSIQPGPSSNKLLHHEAHVNIQWDFMTSVTAYAMNVTLFIMCVFVVTLPTFAALTSFSRLHK